LQVSFTFLVVGGVDGYAGLAVEEELVVLMLYHSSQLKLDVVWLREAEIW
jgi:hypothetical protein